MKCFDLCDYHSPLEIYEEIRTIVRDYKKDEVLILTDLLGGVSIISYLIYANLTMST